MKGPNTIAPSMVGGSGKKKEKKSNKKKKGGIAEWNFSGTSGLNELFRGCPT